MNLEKQVNSLRVDPHVLAEVRVKEHALKAQQAAIQDANANSLIVSQLFRQRLWS